MNADDETLTDEQATLIGFAMLAAASAEVDAVRAIAGLYRDAIRRQDAAAIERWETGLRLVAARLPEGAQ